MTGEKEWQDQVDHGTHKIVGQIQLKAYGKFLEEYATQLQGIQDALDESISESWDAALDPVMLHMIPHEKMTLLQLIDTDNKVLNKVLSVLANLCSEMDFLKSEARNKFYNALLFYGEGEEEDDQSENTHMCMSRMIPLFQELDCFVKRCEEVAQNTIQQMAMLYNSSKVNPPIMDVSEAHFQIVFDHLGELLTVLVTLDEVMLNQVTLQEHWTQYKRMIKSIRHDPERFGTRPDKLRKFEDLLHGLEGRLLQGKIFENCICQSFDNGRGCVTKNFALMEEFSLNITNILGEAQAKSSMNQLGSEHSLRYVSLASLYVLHYHLFRSVDKKFFKQLWDLNRKIPAVSLVGNVLWFPEQFLQAKLPQVTKTLDKKAIQSVEANRLAYLQGKSQSLPRDAQAFFLQVWCWCVRLETSLSEDSDRLKLEDLTRRCSLLVQGLVYMGELGSCVRTVMNLHVATSRPMTRTAVLSLCRLVELLKAIQATFHRHAVALVDSVNHIQQHLTYLALHIIEAAKKGLVEEKVYSTKKLDVLSALILAERALNGPGTRERRLVLRLSLALACQGRTFKEVELATLQAVLRRLDVVCQLQQEVALASDTAFLYWHRVVLPVYFADLYQGKTDAHRIHYIMGALKDCLRPMSAARHTASPQVLVETLDKTVFSYLKEQILDPLCRDIETDLRLHIHSHLQLDDRNPFRVGVKDLSHFLRLRPIRLLDRYLNIKAYVEHYLDQTFYNLTTVALHDWKTYGEMRALAHQKFGLSTVEDHLPSQTLEQGLDVLEIMRNIHIFVSRYLYNLNNQIFVEQSSSNKHLNTINIRHIANSIRTHGTGIMSTTVNFTYQFLRKKFNVFSQFMYDEHIKSRLLRDLRHFRESKSHSHPKYPFDRAEKFNRGIRKLGVGPDGLSYLDRFRMLISQMGNAMGFVRMIRSGGLHCCSNAIRFVPDLEDIVNFEELCKEEGLSEESQQAARRLDQVISNLAMNFAEGAEYFKILVNVFTPAIQDTKNMHLKNFYVIVPPLTVNFVEHMIACKERMNKKNKVGAAFTDDGFAMGLAYILKLLNQYAEFDSLHWFQSVEDKYNEEKAAIQKNKESGSREDEKLQQTMTLTLKRLDMYQQEFELMYYSLSSARIFFQCEHSSADETICSKKSDGSSSSQGDEVSSPSSGGS